MYLPRYFEWWTIYHNEIWNLWRVSQAGSCEEEFDVLGGHAGCSPSRDGSRFVLRWLCTDFSHCYWETARAMTDVSFVFVLLWNLNVGMKPVFRFPGTAADRSNSLFIFRRILILSDVCILCEHSLHLSFVTLKVFKVINRKQLKTKEDVRKKSKQVF
jgi:hypothetical protein